LTTAVAAVVAASGTGAAALKTEINARRYNFTSASASLVHVVTHGLNTAYYDYTTMTKGDDGVFRNDIMSVEETDSNTLTVTYTEARILKITVEDMTAL